MNNGSSLFLILVSLFFLDACTHPDNSEKARREIMETEKEFCMMARDKGMQAAFAFYAADSGIIRRGEQLIIGKGSIGEHYGKSTLSDITLDWKPDFVDASRCGDLGYTYGRYAFSATDTNGMKVSDTGIFHTVWKRQPDGSWRFVWD